METELSLLEADLARVEARLADTAHTARTPQEQLEREWEFRNELRARIEALRERLARPAPVPGGLPADAVGRWSPLPLFEKPREESKADLPPASFEVVEGDVPDRAAIAREIAVDLQKRPSGMGLMTIGKRWRHDAPTMRLIGAALRSTGRPLAATWFGAKPPAEVTPGARRVLRAAWLTEAREVPNEFDGLTPTQRLVLSVMRSAAPAGGAFVRLSSIVADVTVQEPSFDLDTVERTLVSLGHPSLRRLPLVEFQGLTGRFTPPETHLTHARLTRLAVEVLDQAFPLPLLLINGAEGMNASIPPHSPAELCRACRYLLENPRASLSELRPHPLEGPDFPGGGAVFRSRIFDLWGGWASTLKVRPRVRTEVDQQTSRARLVVDQFPWPMTGSEVQAELAGLVASGALDGVGAILDQSSAEGVKLVIELEHLAFSGTVFDTIMKSEVLVRWIDVELRVDGADHPRRPLTDLLLAFIEHRKEVAVKKLDKVVAQARLRAQDLEAVCVALALLEPVQAVMRASDDDAEAVKGLMNFMGPEHREAALTELPFPPSHAYDKGFTERQARYLLTIRKLASRRPESAQQDWAAQLGVVNQARVFLSDRQAILDLVRQELRDALARFDEPRRTQLVSG